MAEPSWDDIFSASQQPPRHAQEAQVSAPEPVSEQFPTARLSDPFAVAAAQANAAQAQAARDAASTTGQPLSRRELRDAEARANGGGIQVPAGRGRGRDGRPPTERPRRWGRLIALIVIVALVAGGGAVAWFGFREKVCKVLTFCQESIDYTGAGNGQKVTFVIQSGDIGSDVAKRLHAAGVTKSFEATYTILLTTNQSFEPGSYSLQKQMSAKAALAALADAKNRIANAAVIREGITAVQAYTQLAVATGRPVSEFEAAAKDDAALGVPSDFPSIEGFLFPATYQFDPGTTAKQALQKLVSTMQEHLKADGVPAGDELKVLTLASIVQREAGSVEDMGKVARVFQNRLDAGMLLQSDATVSYGTGHTGRVTTTGAERADASNPYNTYAHSGLPVGPISLPGDDAIKAAMNPTPGPWLYFVTVDLKTGETVFSTTQAEHDAAVKQWQAWCKESAENMAYCT